MKYSVLAFAILTISTAAYAGDNESPIRGKGAISVVHNEPAATLQRGYTTEQINSALAFHGQPPLGSSRVLHDDHQSERERRFISTIISSSTINSTSTIQSK